MRTVEIELGPVYSLVKDQIATDGLRKLLEYSDFVYKKVKEVTANKKIFMRNKKITFSVPLINQNGLVLTGFIPRTAGLLKDMGYSVTYSKSYKDIPLAFKEIDGFTLREYQRKGAVDLLKRKRGVLEATTRSGKTLIGGTLINALPKSGKVLFMGPKDAMDQALQVFPGYFDEPIGRILGGGIAPERITVGNPETLIRMDDAWFHSIDMVILDECHLLSSFKGRIAGILEKIQAPYRFGLSATLHKEKTKAWYAMEGLLGPLVARIEEEDLAEENFIIQPEVEFILLDRASGASTANKYNDLYSLCISENVQFSRIVAKKAKNIVQAGDSVLILFKNIEHGALLNREVSRALNGKGLVIYLDGKTESESRLEAKKELNEGKGVVVIASSIWKHAVDIPNLRYLINAAGYKGDIPVGQLIGRGKTYSDGKLYYRLVDFMHQAKYLSEHSIARLEQYTEKGYKITVTKGEEYETPKKAVGNL